MESVFEKMKRRIMMVANEACGYTAMTRVVSEAELKDIINDVAAEYNNGWIPCETEMPKEHDSIFARFKGTDRWNNAMFEKTSDVVNVTVSDGKGNSVSTHAHTTDGKWSCDLLGANKSYRIVAWQPLPETYQPKGE